MNILWNTLGEVSSIGWGQYNPHLPTFCHEFGRGGANLKAQHRGGFIAYHIR